MPNSLTALVLVESATKCFLTADSSPSRRTNQSRADQLGKQEKMVESNQRRLAEKMEDATRRQKELDDDSDHGKRKGHPYGDCNIDTTIK